jgi:ABC-type branched-subunit amino acid transport system substrate-binding protein
LERYEEGSRILRTFLEKFPDSEFIADARYTLGLIYYKMQRYHEAAIEFLNALDISSDTRLTKKLEGVIDDLIAERMSVDDLRPLFSKVVGVKSRSVLTIKLVEKQHVLGRVREAEETLSNFLEAHPDTPYRIRGRQLLAMLQEELAVSSNTPMIGILVPLYIDAMGESERNVGKEILDGVQFAFDDYRGDKDVKLSLAVRDTKGDINTATTIMKEYAGDDRVVAVVGPVFTPEALIASRIANSNRIPLISPTATGDGIASIGPYIFQANPDYATRAKAMARYTVNKLGNQVLAVLAPSDTYCKAMADAFVDEARRLGANMIAVAWYESGKTDLSSQCKEIRDAIFRKGEEYYLSFETTVSAVEISKLESYGISKTYVDSLIESKGEVSIYSLFGRRGKRIADSLGIRAVRKRDSRGLGSAAWSLEALYCPIASSKDMGIVLAQLAHYNIKTQILGGGDWDNHAELDVNSRYANGVIFESDFYIDDSDSRYAVFLSEFARKTGKTPTKNLLFGYDTMRLLLNAVSSGANTRDTIKDALSRVRGFPGLHSLISLDHGRVNSDLHILQYRGSQTVKLGDVRVE